MAADRVFSTDTARFPNAPASPRTIQPTVEAMHTDSSSREKAGALEDHLHRVALHPLVREKPSARFFEGALLGNGGLGVVVCVRPDALVLHLGHNAVWDIRLHELDESVVGTFTEVMDMVRKLPAELDDVPADSALGRYIDAMHAARRKPYPRPMPCGTVVLGWDPRRVERLGYRLDIATGRCTVTLLAAGEQHEVECWTDSQSDRVWLQVRRANAEPVRSVFTRVHLLPDPATPPGLPPAVPLACDHRGTLGFEQRLPCREDGEPAADDQAFRIVFQGTAELAERRWIDARGIHRAGDALDRQLVPDEQWTACVELHHGAVQAVQARGISAPTSIREECDRGRTRTTASWQQFWSRSSVTLDDPVLERTWYHNLYFFACATRPGQTCPGLFANWSYGNIGTAWHGDYHMNYNTQQPFWVCFSSNHVERHEPYVDLVHHLLPVARATASRYYGLTGAAFPHCAYPIEMRISPYLGPDWGWQICETPWTVQSLWWHYLYTGDRDFLRDRAFEPMRDAVRFLADYLERDDTHGDPWGDDRFHVVPTVPPELYGLKPGLRFNHDSIIDLSLIRFLFRAFNEACGVLECRRHEQSLLSRVEKLLGQLAEYPTAEVDEGTVWVAAPGADPDMVLNTPNALAPVFPGEDVTGSSSIARRTAGRQRTEGGNELVFENLQRARLGLLDLDRFRRQIEYCLMPNGTCANMVLQTGGRYEDAKPFAFMAEMGVWFENFALPAVINECLLQSVGGTIRLFPNWPLERPATFRTLRAVGGFLVSASCGDGRVGRVEIRATVAGPLRVANPFPGAARMTLEGSTDVRDDEILEAQLAADQVLILEHAADGDG